MPTWSASVRHDNKTPGVSNVDGRVDPGLQVRDFSPPPTGPVGFGPRASQQVMVCACVDDTTHLVARKSNRERGARPTCPWGACSQWPEDLVLGL